MYKSYGMRKGNKKIKAGVAKHVQNLGIKRVKNGRLVLRYLVLILGFLGLGLIFKG